MNQTLDLKIFLFSEGDLPFPNGLPYLEPVSTFNRRCMLTQAPEFCIGVSNNSLLKQGEQEFHCMCCCL